MITPERDILEIVLEQNSVLKDLNRRVFYSFVTSTALIGVVLYQSIVDRNRYTDSNLSR